MRDIEAVGGSYPESLTNVNGTLYFTATRAINGRELWKSDGSQPGTVLIQDTVPGPEGSSPEELTAVGSVLYYSANTPANGRELFRSEGTNGTTRRVRDIIPGPDGGSPTELTNLNGTLMFVARFGESNLSYGKVTARRPRQSSFGKSCLAVLDRFPLN